MPQVAKLYFDPKARWFAFRIWQRWRFDATVIEKEVLMGVVETWPLSSCLQKMCWFLNDWFIGAILRLVADFESTCYKPKQTICVTRFFLISSWEFVPLSLPLSCWYELYRDSWVTACQLRSWWVRRKETLTDIWGGGGYEVMMYVAYTRRTFKFMNLSIYFCENMKEEDNQLESLGRGREGVQITQVENLSKMLEYNNSSFWTS